MITGDHLLVAKKTCKDLDMGDKTRAGWPNMKVQHPHCGKTRLWC